VESVAGYDISLLVLKAKIFNKTLPCYEHRERVKTRTEILGNIRNKNFILACGKQTAVHVLISWAAWFSSEKTCCTQSTME